MSTSGLEHKRRERRGDEFLGTIEEELGRRLKQRIKGDPALSSVLKGVQDGVMEPYSAASKLLDGALDTFEGISPDARGPD